VSKERLCQQISQSKKIFGRPKKPGVDAQKIWSLKLRQLRRQIQKVATKIMSEVEDEIKRQRRQLCSGWQQKHHQQREQKTWVFQEPPTTYTHETKSIFSEGAIAIQLQTQVKQVQIRRQLQRIQQRRKHRQIKHEVEWEQQRINTSGTNLYQEAEYPMDIQQCGGPCLILSLYIEYGI
jgi:hypothetical protein